MWDTTDDGLASADVLRWIPGRAVGAQPLSAGNALPAAGAQLPWILRGNALSTSTMFSGARYEAVGGFRSQFRGAEDWDLWIRMVRAGAVVVRPQHPTVLYRLRAEGASAGGTMTVDRVGVLELNAADKPFTDAAERRGFRVGLRRATAERDLHAAYAAASAGDTSKARAAGLKATRGVKSVAVRGLAMALAPRVVAKRRDAVRHDVDVWLKRYGPGGSA